MYLSRVKIDNNNRQKIQQLDDLESYHGWIESCFPQEFSDHVRTRKLWRLDNVYGQIYMILVSSNKPDLNNFEKYGVPNSAQSINYDKLLDNIKAGMSARFKLVTNPTYSKSSGKRSGKRGRVIQCFNYDDQIHYLEKRSINNGFQLVNHEYTITNKEIYILKRKNKKRYYLRKVCYEGRLIIKDVDKFRQILCKGLGAKKAYGCGLMTIIPEWFYE